MAKTMIREKNATSQDAKKQHKKLAKQEAKLMLKVEEAKKAVQRAESKVAKAQTTLHGHNTKLHKLEDQLTHLRSGQQEPSAEAGDPAPSAQPDSQDLSSPQAEQDNHSNQNGSHSSNGAYDAHNAQDASPSAATDTPAIPTNQIDAQPPAEGRVDVSQDVDASATSDNDVSSSNSADSTADKGVNTTMQNNSNAQETPDQNMQQAEESLHIDSGDGSMPIVTNDPQAWPPPEVRKEVADAVVEEVKQPHGHQEGQTADTTNTTNTAQTSSGEVSQADEEQTQLQQRYGYGDKG
jgi:hypothetical protein